MTITRYLPVVINQDISRIVVDAGTEQIRLRFYGRYGKIQKTLNFASNCDLKHEFIAARIFELVEDKQHVPAVYITGKLAEVIQQLLGHGVTILPAAALWSAMQAVAADQKNTSKNNFAVIDLSASGYLIIGTDIHGGLKDNLFVSNPRCGAGTGINIDRILQKLAIPRSDVDRLLGNYLGEAGMKARKMINIRTDRCGVFSSSATISDKNQGIPLQFALAVTLKSEVMKACSKLPAGIDKVYLTGGVFKWQFTRDCAHDYLLGKGVHEIDHDADQSLIFTGIMNLVEHVGQDNFLKPDVRLKNPEKLAEYPSFVTLKREMETKYLYRRLPDEPIEACPAEEFESREVYVGLDVGSTMAKSVITDAGTNEILFLDSQSNCGDTIETIKRIFRNLQSRGLQRLNIVKIGITGSARYQVREALQSVYPGIKPRIAVLVENYAHARGSISHAREHIRYLKEQGIRDINENFILLVDIGGEDTKLSSISLQREDLFDNAMNVKCSAGTGSLMDTLRALFNIDSIAVASRMAYMAGRAYDINATCAVFLMENARKLQAMRYPQDEILASTNWAIVENMARTLWGQLEMPKNAVVMLHGQTMLSEPLPLAVTHRLQEFLGTPCYGLVPPNPGHMACLGLIKTMADEEGVKKASPCFLEDLICREFRKRVIQCRGKVCGDPEARCNRTSLSGIDCSGKKFQFSLGGCTAINEIIGHKNNSTGKTPDTYKDIWEFIDNRLPRSEDPDRLIIPRSFSVSEYACFFAQLFQQLKLPVHVDNVQKDDIINAQPLFNIDTCAPQIGAVGQYRRLASEQHGMILAPQIEYLPTNGSGLGRTCTTNQGGVMVAKNLAEVAFPDARFHLFNVNLKQDEVESLACQLFGKLEPVFSYYGIRPTASVFKRLVERAMTTQSKLKEEVINRAADIIQEALRENRQIALIVGREYILNPGIYDSHVGRLLRDKHLTALPSYIFDLEPDPDYAHIYWRNPHHIISVLKAIATRRLHEILYHPRLRELFKQIETDPTGSLLPVVQVSTFSCGPDSITAPMVAEIMKKRPFLLIQSDAVIKELAHLENRVNTYIKQLELDLYREFHGVNGRPFEIKFLDTFTNDRTLDRETDVIYFPTLADNRVVTSVMRSAGFTCIDNFNDETYDLIDIVKKGRRIAGDSVCAPMAAVYGDVIRAIEDFTRRKKSNDALVFGKHRILIFNNKGSGPCRQGQYADLHRLYAYRMFSKSNITVDKQTGHHCQLPGGSVLKFIVAEEAKNFNFGVDEWTHIRCFQGAVLQGVLHVLLFEGGAQCEHYDEYLDFLADFRKLKQELYRLQEHRLQPYRYAKGLIEYTADWPSINVVMKYIGYRLYARDLQTTLHRFAKKWLSPRRKNTSPKLKIYIDGEVYMRVAQAEKIFNILLSTLGFRRFTLQYSPMWNYLEYLLEEEMFKCREKIQQAQNQLRGNGPGDDADRLKGTVRKNNKVLTRLKWQRFLLRRVLAEPLYNAIGAPMPHPMASILETSKIIMPTHRPAGELGPYVGEVVIKLKESVDFFLNVAPVGCMVSSMGEILTPKILQESGTSKGQVQNLFSSEGDVDEEVLTLALLKTLGPVQYYRQNTSSNT